MQLEEIFEKLVERPFEESSSAEYKEEIYHNFSEVYADENYRHSYYEISTYLESLGCDVSDMLEGSIQNVLEYSAGIDSSSNVTKKISKLSDHISLELLRLSRMNKIKYLSDKIHKEMNETNKAVVSKHNEMDEIDKKVNNIHAEVITILGIFAGLVVGFSIDFQLLAQSFSNLKDVSFFKEIAFLSIIGIILFDSIFLLMFAVSRISQRSLAVNCKYKDCQNCDDCKMTLKILIHKYPYVFWYNLILVITFIICVLLQTFVMK